MAVATAARGYNKAAGQQIAQAICYAVENILRDDDGS
jgi:hypothetical protein